MTMRITIKNHHLEKVARATAEYISDQPHKVVSEIKDIKPGEEQEFWIFQGVQVRVEEL